MVYTKNMIKLDKRLAACAALVRQGRSIADIGSDHALIPCFLWQSGWTDIIASDVKPGPLESARRNLEKYKADIKLVLSDGFERKPPAP
jgi:tRNA (adenine22-N1)-methyltransferase